MTQTIDQKQIAQLKDLDPSQYEYLLNQPVVLAGIWESSTAGQDLFNQQQQQAQENLKLAQELQQEIKIIEDLREKVKQSTQQLESNHIQLQQAQSEMYSAIEPFSLHGIKNEMQRLYSESQDICTALERSFLDDNNNLQTFIADYQKQQYLKHLRKIKIDSLT